MSRWEIPSPDDKHVAIRVGTLCSTGFGNNSNGESVVLDTRPGGSKSAEEIFITFDTPPDVRWLNNHTVEITVRAVNAINLSRKDVKDIKVAYRLRDGLTETAIRKQLADEQRRMTEHFGSSATGINANAQQRFEAFIRWAKEHAALEP